jgi:hypothetical protein
MKTGWILRSGFGGLLLAGLFTVVCATEPEMRLSPRPIRDEVRSVVQSQLTALQAGDFAGAYALAARGIRRQYDQRLFTVMMRRGYAPLLKPNQADLGVVRDDGEGSAQLSVTVTDRANRRTIYRYWLVREEKGWRISGVVLEQKPPRGDT